MPNTIPAARLEKLWRRLRQARGRALAQGKKSTTMQYPGAASRGEAYGLYCAADDLRKIIDEAKGEDDAKA